MASTSRTVDIIFKGRDQASGAASSVENSLRGLNTEARGASGTVGELDDQFDDFGRSGRNNIDLLVAGFQALAASVVVREFIDANAAIEKFQRSLTFATGSSEAAAREFDFISQSAERFGVELLSTADAYSRFFGAASQTLTVQETREVFEGFAGTLSIVGGTADDVSGAFVQLSQGLSKGKFELEDLKSVAERLPGFFNQFADSLGVTTEEFFDLISAGEIGTEELLTFSRALNQALDGQNFEGYQQSVNRLKNAFTGLAEAVGDTGAFDLIVSGIDAATTVLESGAQNIDNFGAAWDQVKSAFTDADGPVDAITRLDKGILLAAATAIGLGDAARDWVPPIEDANAQLEEIVVTAERIPTPIEEARSELELLATVGETANKLLKAIGIDPKQLEEPIEKVVQAFDQLANLDGVSGDDLFKGLIVTLDKLSSDEYIPFIKKQIDGAFADGTLSAQEYEQAIAAITSRNADLLGTVDTWDQDFAPVAEGFQKSTKEAKKAEEQVAKTALELEKLASNERIANIEARVSLNVADIEADAQKAVAVIENIGVAIQSTGELLGSLFNNRVDADSWEERRQIESQITKENERRETQLKKNNQLIDEQIKKTRAQAEALRRGDSLIKIDGAGLQPHLEAFMFEILESIQVRVNAEGGELLLGVGA